MNRRQLSSLTIPPNPSNRLMKYYTASATYGNTASATSSGSFNRFTQQLVSYKAISIEQIIWNIFTAETYNIELVDGLTASPTILATLVSGASLTGGSVDNTMTLTTPYLLRPGVHYLSIYCATPVRQRRNGTDVTTNALFATLTTAYDGTTPTGSTCGRFVGPILEYVR